MTRERNYVFMKKRRVIVGFMLVIVASVVFVLGIVLGRQEIYEEERAFTCWMDYVDEGSDAEVSDCVIGAASAYYNYDDYSNERPGDFPIIVKGLTLDEFLRSEFNVNNYKKNNGGAGDAWDELIARGEAPPMMSFRLSELREHFDVVVP